MKLLLFQSALLRLLQVLLPGVPARGTGWEREEMRFLRLVRFVRCDVAKTVNASKGL